MMLSAVSGLRELHSSADLLYKIITQSCKDTKESPSSIVMKKSEKANNELSGHEDGSSLSSEQTTRSTRTCKV